MTSYLVKRHTTLSNSDNEGMTYIAGDVLSDWEVPDLVKNKIKEGVSWYMQNLEALTDKEAELYRKKATAVEGKRIAPDGQNVDPPWEDYIGLHPKEIIDRMKDLSFDDVEKVRQYERAGMNRAAIIEFVAPSEREPWHEYDNWAVRDTIEKMEILDPQTVQDVIVYELNHRRRAAIITYEVEEDTFQPSPQANLPTSEEEESADSEPEMAGVGAGSTDVGGQP